MSRMMMEDNGTAAGRSRLARLVAGHYVSAMSTLAPPVTPTTVLIVDDEDGIRHALNRFLSRLGYRVLQAASAAEALDQQAADLPHAMLSDIRMPNMTGVELVPKALAHDSDLAIIMLTAIDEPRTAIECLKLGAYDYLIKPVDLDELQLSLQGALRQRQLEIERRELEQWLAREVAVRTRDLEDHTATIARIALDAVAATNGWPGEQGAFVKLAKALGTPVDELVAEVRKRRG
jgi:DNA-binding NtrC family response regulator